MYPEVQNGSSLYQMERMNSSIRTQISSAKGFWLRVAQTCILPPILPYQKPSSESSSSSIIVCANNPCSSFFLPPSFSSHSEYLLSTEGSTFHFNRSGFELRFFSPCAARIEDTERPVSSGLNVNLNSDARILEDIRKIEPVSKPMRTADPKNMMRV